MDPKDPKLNEKEQQILNWIEHLIHQKCTKKFEEFIQDGSILSKVMTTIVFNSVPMEEVDDNTGSNPAQHRVETLIREIERYGIKDVFRPDDLLHKRHVVRVVNCLMKLADKASHDPDALVH